MNLTFPFRRLIIFFTQFSSTLRVINIEVFKGEFFTCIKPESMRKILPLADVREVVLQCVLLLHFS